MRRLPAMLAVLLLLLLSGCSGTDGVDWSALAPEEGDRLVIYTSHSEAVYEPVIREFEERTGIWVQVETGGTAELLDRLKEEEDHPRCDLLFGGGVDSLTAQRALFAPYISPLAEELDPAYRCADGSWTAFSVLPVVLIYNPVLVRMNPPEGWESLLDPVWQGRIAFADPLASGSGYAALATFLQALPGEEGVLLASFYDALDGNILSSSGEAVGVVANGSCTVGVALEDAALRAVEAGSDVVLLYPKEGTSAIADGMAVINGCAHEDNARRFIDFALGEDAQRCLLRSCRRPVRPGLEEPDWDSGELVLIDYDLAWAAEERTDILDKWRLLAGKAAS